MSQPSQSKPSGQRTQTRERDDATTQSSAQEQPTGQEVAVSQRQENYKIVKNTFDLPERRERIETLLPPEITFERFKSVSINALNNAPDLLDCDPRSLFNAFIAAAQDGLLPDKREGAIVAYKGQAQWLPMIGGIRKKARNSGEISIWEVQAVFEKDQFDFELGDEPFIRHKPYMGAGDAGPLVFVYSVVTLKDGTKSRDVMSKAQVDKIRSKSRAQKGPWSDPIFYPEMAKKTVAKRHGKILPMSSDLDRVLSRGNEDFEFDEDTSQRPIPPRPRLNAALQQIGRPAGPAADEVPHDPETGEVAEDRENREPETAAAAKPSEKPVGAGNAAGATSAAAEGEKRTGDAGAKEKAASEGKGEPAETRSPQRIAFDEGVEAKGKGRTVNAMPPHYAEPGAENLRSQWRAGHGGKEWAGELADHRNG